MIMPRGIIPIHNGVPVSGSPNGLGVNSELENLTLRFMIREVFFEILPWLRSINPMKVDSVFPGRLTHPHVFRFGLVFP